MAITWQNINSPSFEGVGRLMEGAQSSVDAGLIGLLNILKQKQGLNQQIATDAFDARTEGAMGILGGFKTAADLQQAQDSGALEQQLATQFGPKGYDKKRVREFADTRKGWLMDQGIKVNTFQEQERLKEEAAQLRLEQPEMDDIITQAYTDPTGAMKRASAFTGKKRVEAISKVDAIKDEIRQEGYDARSQERLDEDQRMQAARDAQATAEHNLKMKALLAAEKDREDALVAADALRIVSSDFKKRQDAFGKRFAELVGLPKGTVFNPLTATPKQAQAYELYLKNADDALVKNQAWWASQKKTKPEIDKLTADYYKKYVRFGVDDPATTMGAEADARLSKMLTPRQLEFARSGLSSALSSFTPVTGDAIRTAALAADTNDKVLNEYSKTGRFSRSYNLGNSVGTGMDVYDKWQDEMHSAQRGLKDPNGIFATIVDSMDTSGIDKLNLADVAKRTGWNTRLGGNGMGTIEEMIKKGITDPETKEVIQIPPEVVYDALKQATITGDDDIAQQQIAKFVDDMQSTNASKRRQLLREQMQEYNLILKQRTARDFSTKKDSEANLKAASSK